jgi:hypothetical protein
MLPITAFYRIPLKAELYYPHITLPILGKLYYHDRPHIRLICSKGEISMPLIELIDSSDNDNIIIMSLKLIGDLERNVLYSNVIQQFKQLVERRARMF